MIHRVILSAILSAVLALAVPAVALACSPGMRTPSPVAQQGPDCALTVDIDETDQASLGYAVALGARMFLQPLNDGNGCYNRQHLLVHDCAARQVMIIGTERFSMMEALDRRRTGGGPADRPVTGLEAIREAALAARDAGRGQTLEDFAVLSRAHGYGEPQLVRTDQSLRFGTRTLPLSCACRRGPGAGS